MTTQHKITTDQKFAFQNIKHPDILVRVAQRNAAKLVQENRLVQAEQLIDNWNKFVQRAIKETDTQLAELDQFWKELEDLE